MGLRFQKRIRLFKGLTLNLSKTGSSFTVGGRGASLNFRKGKVTQTLGIPNTGLSYRRRLDSESAVPQREVEQPIIDTNSHSNGWKILAIIFFLAFVFTLFALLNT